ncbi:DEAD/DEAH box helicase [Microbacterium sp. gxy059]|uniref:DEAD/DEAH box helicase n=1 Tax=Microbacterium sp. gxy059 TaxID=2957199 RepID=UPI003D99DEA0
MTSADTQTPSFADLGVPSVLVDALVAVDRPTPFPIQRETLPSTLAGRDVLGRGKTGSGKTLAFAIPMVARLAENGEKGRPGQPTGLVLAPTRELATQIAKVIAPLARAAGLTVTTVFGGVSQKPQEAAFRSGVDIVVACPGRLEDLISQRIVRLDRVAITVLDEADHMADLGFLPVVTRLLSQTPKGGQRLLFSATLDNGVSGLAKRFLSDPVEHSIDSAASPVPAMTHHVFEAVDPDAKKALIRTLASGTSKRILFSRTKHQAKRLAKQLTASGIPAVDLQGNLSQNARDRNLAELSSGRVKVLVATDVAARGVHIDDVDLVVHMDPPADHKAYLHRSGRTARAGNSGDVVTIMTPDQRGEVRQLLRHAGIQAKPQQVEPDSAAVTELVGEVAEHVAPRPGGPGSGNAPAPGSTGGGQSQGANARRKRAARDARQGGQGSGQGGRSRGGRGAQGGSGAQSGAGRSGGQAASGRAGGAQAGGHSAQPQRAQNPNGQGQRGPSAGGGRRRRRASAPGTSTR